MFLLMVLFDWFYAQTLKALKFKSKSAIFGEDATKSMPQFLSKGLGLFFCKDAFSICLDY